MQKFQSVVTTLIQFATVIDTINAEQFDALVSMSVPQFALVELVELQSFGYSVSIVRKDTKYRIMIEKN